MMSINRQFLTPPPPWDDIVYGRPLIVCKPVAYHGNGPYYRNGSSTKNTVGQGNSLIIEFVIFQKYSIACRRWIKTLLENWKTGNGNEILSLARSCCRIKKRKRICFQSADFRWKPGTKKSVKTSRHIWKYKGSCRRLEARTRSRSFDMWFSRQVGS